MTYGAFQRAFFLDLQRAGLPLEEVRALWARWTEWTHGNRLVFSMVDPKMPLPNHEAAQAVLDRLKRHEPWAHIRGKVDFAGLSLAIDSRALIPRPETEEVLHAALEVLPVGGRLLDWCSGSGCIALAAKQHRPDAHVEGWEWSDEALALARENQILTDLDVDFMKADLNHSPTGNNESYDVVVSNPPYVHPSEILDLSVAEYEPQAALYSPESDVLHFYRRIEAWAQVQVVPGGYVVLECHAEHARDAAALFTAGWKAPEILFDFCGKERTLRVQRA